MASGIEVKGLPQLEAACKTASKETKKAVKAELKKAGVPVQQRAQELAVGNIRNIGERWSRMRIGSAGSRLVYVAPRARRRGGSPRANLANLLMTKSMRPALDASTEEVKALLEAAVERGTAGF